MHVCFLSPRYKGIFLHSRVQLRASRLRKPRWVLRKDCPPPPLKGPDPRGTHGQASSEVAGKAILGGESTLSTRLLGCGRGWRQWGDRCVCDDDKGVTSVGQSPRPYTSAEGTGC